VTETGNDHPQLFGPPPDPATTDLSGPTATPACSGSVTLNNAFGPAQVSVAKFEQFRGQTSGSPAIGHWTFALTGPNGFSSTQKTNEPAGGPNITVNSNVITWNNLTPGDYTLCEKFFASSWRISFSPSPPGPGTKQLNGDVCVSFSLISSQVLNMTALNVCTSTVAKAIRPGITRRRRR
jgi:hypothetical protein